MARPLQPISLAGSQLGEVRHVCAFFANDDEEYRVLLPFIREGLSRGDKSVNVVNPEAREEHLQRLAAGRHRLRRSTQKRAAPDPDQY